MKVTIPRRNQKGNGLLITMILVLVMMVIVVGSLSIAGLQSDINNIDKETSNTYTLAKSATEKAVDNINKEIELATYDIMDEVRKETLAKIKTELSTISSQNDYDKATFLKDFIYVEYTEDSGAKGNMGGSFTNPTNQIVYKDGAKLRDIILTQVRKSLLADGTGAIVPKKISYEVNSDYTYDIKNQKDPGSKTVVTVTISPGTALKDYEIDAVAQVIDSSGKTIESQQRVHAQVEVTIPDKVYGYLTERYKWFDPANPAEILSGAIISYSPITVTQGKIHTVGDMKVTGDRVQKITITDADIAALTAGKEFNFPLVKSYTGVNVSDGTLDVDGNLYCAGNVSSTGGTIDVEQDVVADTLAIFDNFYPDGGGSLEPWADLVTGTITIGNNAYVENDVAIEKYTTDSTITVGKSIFGVMDGDQSNTGKVKDAKGKDIFVVDPNRSSGVFNRGQGISMISAKNIYVHGQPYITYHDGNGFHALFESVGEPYEENLYYLDPYRLEQYGETDYYINNDPYKQAIKNDQIRYTGEAFAPQYISANGVTKTENALSASNDKSVALPFFYRGGGPIPSSLTSEFSPYIDLWGKFPQYYAADPSFKGKADFYAKKIAPTGTVYGGTEYFGGVRAIMTAKRAPLYGLYNNGEFNLLSFAEATNLQYLEPKTWSVANPVVVVDSGTVDISDFYVDGTIPYPTVIISKGALTLTSNSGKNKFRGVIVSAGHVKVLNSIDVEGTMVLGDGIELNDSSTELNVTHNPNIIFEANYADKEVFRYILDALNITNFKGSGKNIVNALNAFTVDGLSYTYTLPRVLIADDLHLTVETKNIIAEIKEVKKIEN